MTRARRLLRPLAERLAAGPLGRAVERLSSGPAGLAVLAYHRVVPERGEDPFSLAVSASRFEEQVRFLVSRYPVLPLDRAIEDLEAGRLPARRAVAITFDDGYRDVKTRAAPILERLRAPATLFLSTASASSGAPYWWDLLPPLPSGAPGSLHRRAKAMAPDERDRLVASFGGPPPRDPDAQPMRFAEVRGLPGSIRIGGHGDRHLSLGLAPADSSRRDVASCAAALRRELPGHIRLFAYPFGAPEDVSEHAARAVREAGFAAAFTTEEGIVRRGMDRYRLPRVRAREEGAGALALRLLRAFAGRRGGL